MGIVTDIIVIALVGGYAGYLIWHIISSMKAGKGNPYGCGGDCAGCHGGCSCHSASKPGAPGNGGAGRHG